MFDRNDIIGKHVGKWTVIQFDDNNKNIYPYYICKCDCGTVKPVIRGSLISGSSRSCGCLVKDKARERIGKPWNNRKDLTGQRFGRLVVLGFAGTKGSSKGKGEGMRFTCQCDCGNICEVVSGHLKDDVVTSCGCVAKESYTKIFAKRKQEVNVDNTDLDRLTSKPTKANTSGARGVFWREDRHRWVAMITFQGVCHMRHFKTFEEAVAGRRRMEEEFWKPTLEKYGRKLE